MSAVAVKYCPLCDAENPAFASFCEQCDGDLLNAPVVPRRDLAGATDAASNEATSTSHVGPHADSISQAEIASIPARDEETLPTMRAATGVGGVLRLELVENPALSFVVRPGQSVGRANKADVVLHGVPGLEYISRVHALFSQRRGQWFVQYVAEGNFIKVDDTEYSDDSEVALYDDSILVMSLSSFRVRLR